MTKMTYSITCISSQEHQQMLLKSLVNILGIQTQSRTEWTYVDQNTADVIIFDYDDGLPNQYPSAMVVGFSRNTSLLKEIPFALHKPLRSRDLLNLLSELDEHLRKKQQKHLNYLDAEQSDTNDPLDIILTLVRNNSHSMFSLHFDEQVVYLEPAKKKIFTPHSFSYAAINKDSDFQYHSLPELPNISLKQISIADFFYEFTVNENNAHLLSGLNSDARFQIKQWPNFANNQNTKSALKISAYFSKQKATLQTAAQELSLDINQLFGFINAVHAQNLLIFDTEIPIPTPIVATTATTAPVVQENKKVSGLFGRIRQRFGL